MATGGPEHSTPAARGSETQLNEQAADSIGLAHDGESRGFYYRTDVYCVCASVSLSLTRTTLVFAVSLLKLKCTVASSPSSNRGS